MAVFCCHYAMQSLSLLKRCCLCLISILSLPLGGMISHCAAQSCGQRAPCADHEPRSTTIPKPQTTWLASPNFQTRDSINFIDSIVIHTTEVSLAGTLDIFLDRDNAVSAHFVIAPNGDIYQMVDTRNSAWHATYYNARSIGIEMVGYAHQRSTWNENNLESLEHLLAWLMQAYPHVPLTRPAGNAYDYPNDRLNAPGWVAHGQLQPWNRSDPGPYFPWDDMFQRVGDRLAAATVPEPNLLLLWLVAGSVIPTRLVRVGR